MHKKYIRQTRHYYITEHYKNKTNQVHQNFMGTHQKIHDQAVTLLTVYI